MSSTDVELGAAERAVLLAFADDEHLMGQRHTEWIGVAPFLEEDLAFSSIAQDELGHAAALYELLVRDAGVGDVDAIDELAFGRPAEAYRSCWLVEAPCTDWAEALVRHWCYDAAEAMRWQALAASVHPQLRSIAERALAEERYHRRHADAMLDALGDDGVAASHVCAALATVLPLVAGLFESPAGSEGADRAVVGPPLEELRAPWTSAAARRFGSVDGALATPGQLARSVRSPWFAEVYGRMREVLSIDPSARW